MPDRPRYTATGPAQPLAGLGGGGGANALWDLLEQVRFDANGLVPAIVQDAGTAEVLTLAYMNRQSLELTLSTGQSVFWSRSRQELWHKGATSGNFQHVTDIRLDCDGDALLVRVHPLGPACHTGEISCFHTPLAVEPAEIEELARMLGDGADAV